MGVKGISLPPCKLARPYWQDRRGYLPMPRDLKAAYADYQLQPFTDTTVLYKLRPEPLLASSRPNALQGRHLLSDNRKSHFVSIIFVCVFSWSFRLSCLRSASVSGGERRGVLHT
jgi:hypothetical protein